MIFGKTSVDLSPAEIEVIEAALHTQEKILAMQTRAGGDVGAAHRLTKLKSTLRTLRRQNPTLSRQSSWGDMARGLFS